MSWPYVESLTTATPYPGSPTCTQRCAAISNLAASHEVFWWVGRKMCPNWVSEADRSACTSTGKAALRNFSDSCQSIEVSMSTRFAPGRSRSVWVTLDRLKDRFTTTVATPSTVLKSTLSTSVTSRTLFL